ncbi:MAG TPA: SDR family oxidoreductase [Nitrososphaera sp.]|jgi:3-oxoacyl-[acyl-carrier protein] reductase
MPAAIVTGSGRGIGRETATLLARRGVDVVVCSRTQSEIDDTVKMIKGIHAGVIGIRCDVSNLFQVDNLVRRAVEEFGGVDILVNNAGIFTVKKLVDTSEKEWDQILDVNLKGAFLCSKAVLPYMFQNNSGTIINVSSGAGKSGFDSMSAYCASKFGMMGLTESLAWEVAGHNIRVMAICPGEVATRMQESDPEYYRENRGRMLQPEEVAAKIIDMIFSSKYGNGQSIDI